MITIKGSNRYLSPTFVNDEEVKLRNDGRFLHSFALEPGKNSIYISYKNQKNEVITTHVFGKRLPLPIYTNSMFSTDEDLTQLALFYNSPLYDNKNFTTNKIYMSRLDLALFIYQYAQFEESSSLLKAPSDIKKRALIEFVTSKNIMTVLYDGSFHSGRYISEKEAMISICKSVFGKEFLSMSRDYTSKNLHQLAETIFKHHNINIAASLNSKLSVYKFSKWIGQFEKIKPLYSSILKVSVTSPEKDEWDSIQEKIKKRLSSNENMHTHIHFTDSKPYIYKYNEPILITGHMQPIQPISSNIPISTIEESGHFSIKIPTSTRVIELEMNALNSKKVTRNWIILPSFNDLKSHWVQKSLSKLYALNIQFDINQPLYFYPKNRIQLKQFAWFVHQNFLKEKNLEVDKNLIIRGLDQNSPYYEAMQMLITQGIIKKNKYNYYPHSRFINRSVGLTMLVRLSKQLTESPQVKPLEIKIKSVDVQRLKWFIPSLEYAIANKIVRNQLYFNPKRNMSRSDLAMMTYQLPYIQKKLKDKDLLKL